MWQIVKVPIICGKKEFLKKLCFSLDGAIKTRKITLAAPLKDDLKKGSG